MRKAARCRSRAATSSTRYGCDALRFTLAALAAPGRDIKLAESRVEGYRNFATKLWNAARYAQMNGCAFDTDFDPGSARLAVNRWITAALGDCAAAVTAALDSFRFDEAANRLYQFVWGSFCDWYLEFSKPILQGADEADCSETRAATAWVLRQILHLLHPIMPFITEEIWQQLAGPDAGLLLIASWPKFAAAGSDRTASAEMEWILAAISAIRGVRAELNVPPAARLTLFIRDAEPAAVERIERHHEHFVRLARIGRIERLDPATTLPDGTIQLALDGATLILPIGETVDLGRERLRLAREIERVEAEIGKLAQRLDNPNFVAKAQPEIVEEQRERAADAARNRDRLRTALARLATV